MGENHVSVISSKRNIISSFKLTFTYQALQPIKTGLVQSLNCVNLGIYLTSLRLFLTKLCNVTERALKKLCKYIISV